MKKSIISALIVSILCLAYFFNNRLIVVEKVDHLNDQDTLGVGKIQEKFGINNPSSADKYAAIYHISPFSRKVAFKFEFVNDHLNIFRETINEGGILNNPLDSSQIPSNESVSIDTIQSPASWTAFFDSLFAFESVEIQSERRINLLTRKKVIYFDEDMWYLELRNGTNKKWVKWYAGSNSKKWIENRIQ
jgi:hypothetical protein